MASPWQDNVRTLALAGSCTAFVATPNLGALIGKGEQTRQYDTVITPPDYAFAVWAPIFAGCALSTIGQCLPSGRSNPVSRRTGWPLAGAYAVNTAWSLAAQNGRFAATPFLLAVATAFTATAHLRLQRTGRPARWTSVTPASTGLLLGWTALASVVNIAGSAVAAGAGKTAPRTVNASAAGLLGASAALAYSVTASRRGGPWLAVASGWGLLTTAITSGKPPRVRTAAGAGAAAIALALAHSRRQSRP